MSLKPVLGETTYGERGKDGIPLTSSTPIEFVEAEVMAATKLFLVVVQDTVLQATGYLIRAADEDDARSCLAAGMYIEETKPEILDTLDTNIVDVTEISEKATGQERK
jgi:hypothetical protein